MNAFADPDLLTDFLTEAGEMLDGVDAKLVDPEQRPADAALLNDIFRGFHTIKGARGSSRRARSSKSATGPRVSSTSSAAASASCPRRCST